MAVRRLADKHIQPKEFAFTAENLDWAGRVPPPGPQVERQFSAPPPSVAHGFPLPRAHAGRRRGDPLLARHRVRGGGSVTTAIAAVLLVLAALTPVRAELLTPHVSQFCAARYGVMQTEMGTNWRSLALLFPDGRRWYQRISRAEWVDCFCKESWCDCCERDITKWCAWIAHRNRTTNDYISTDLCTAG
jgi:hypothetical protein